MADAHKAPGQNVHGKAADELHGRQGHDLPLAALAIIFVRKADGILVYGCEPVIGDGNLVGVASQVFHHRGWSGKSPLGIHHPLLFEQCINQLPVHIRQAFFELLYIFSLEHFAHGFYREEELTLGFSIP